MQDSSSSVLRRALGLGVLAALLAASFWLFASKNTTDKDSKKKRRPSVAETKERRLSIEEAKETKPLHEKTPEVPTSPATEQAPTSPATEQVPTSPVTEQVPTSPATEQVPPSPVTEQVPPTPVTKPNMEVIVTKFESKDESLTEEDLRRPEEPQHSLSWVEMMDEEDPLDEPLELSSQTKSQPKFVPSDQRKSSSTDSGVASPTENTNDQLLTSGDDALLKCSQSRKNSDGATSVSGAYSAHPSCSSSDSGQGSEAGGGMKVSYHFRLPGDLLRYLIGQRGTTINHLRQDSNCDVNVLRLREYDAALAYQYTNGTANFDKDFIHTHTKMTDMSRQGYNDRVVIIEGTRQSIDRCLEYLRDLFPPTMYPELTFDQLNKANSASGWSDCNFSQQTMLAQNSLYQVFVSAVINPGHIFIQDISHPSFQLLPRLDTLINNTYSKGQCPALITSDIVMDLVCVALADERWYRVQVVSFDESSQQSCVKFVDYGGYATLPITDLRKIRSDFLKLPFQAIECYLANIIPKCSSEWPLGAETVLIDLLNDPNQSVTCRMLGIAEDQIPMVHIYTTSLEGQTRLLNRDIVDHGSADWIDFVEVADNTQQFY